MTHRDCRDAARGKEDQAPEVVWTGNPALPYMVCLRCLQSPPKGEVEGYEAPSWAPP